VFENNFSLALSFRKGLREKEGVKLIVKAVKGDFSKKSKPM